MFNTKFLFIALLAILAPATLSAATIIEGIDYVDTPSADLGTLGGGTHIISGNLSGSCFGAGAPYSCGFGADPEDIFTIDIGSAVKMLEFDITFASVQAFATDFGSSFTFSSPAQNFTFSSLADGLYTVAGLTPTSGVLTFIISGDDSDVGTDWSSDWTVELKISPVPIPGAIGLLASGLLGLGALGRRQKPV